ncbi:Cyclin-D4-1 [Zea mays]|uniref:Cyclin-D4-1 n=1 Tax=Zea mays TaxID=4577 RepID=A0A3L6DDV2_MAIZE|nr:Cyclin-D4-1 [Zea mays]
MDPVEPPLPAEPALQLQRRRRGETRSCRVPAQQVAAPSAIAGSFGHQITKILQRGMAPSSYEMAASTLLCGKDSNSILDLEVGAQEEEEVLLAWSRTRGEPSVVFPVPSEDCVTGFMEAETAHMPREDYAERLRGGGTNLRVRTDAIHWIWKVHAYYGFGPLTAYLAVNYLDRFLSLYQLPEGKSWTTQLLSVACLSLAAKMEETYVPPSLDLQERAAWVSGPRRSPRLSPPPWPARSTLWILTRLAPTTCTRYAVCLSRCPRPLLERVSRCLEAIQATVALLAPGTVPAQPLKAEGPSSGRSRASSSSANVPRSPTGVLDAGCLSYRSDDADGRFVSYALHPPAIATRCPACHRQSLLGRADGSCMEAITESRMLYLFRSQPFWRMNKHRERVREEADTAGTCPSLWRCSGDGDRHWHGEAAKPTAVEPHPEEGLAVATADVHCYDVLSNKWTRLTPLGEPPSPRAAHVATAVGTMVVIQGGIGPAGLSAEDLHVLDLTQ